MSRSDLIPPSPSEADYERSKSDADDLALFSRDEPFALFAEWLREAGEQEPNDPNAMSLATVDADGAPDVRIVLLKDFDARGFTFYSNGESAKGIQLAARPQAALCFHWKSLRRAVRIRGTVAEVASEDADEYFASRARISRIGAWASDQSRPLESRFALEQKAALMTARFGLGEVPRPPHWTGWRLDPTRIEFWRDRPFRLHDRLEFTRTDAAQAWAKRRLYP